MLRFFKSPETHFTNFYDLARFKVAWKVNLYLSLALFLLSFFFLFTNFIFFIQYAIGFLIVSSGLIFLRSTFNYKLVSIFVAISSTILVLSSLFLVPNIPHLIEPLWLIAIAIFAYFNLGNRWGSAILAAVIVSLFIYVNFFMNDNYMNIERFTDFRLIGVGLELAVTMFVIGYFVSTAISTNAFVENKFAIANKELNEQNKIIASQNEEKTVLLQEIHHRVKNNLQVITSLLRLQSNELPSNEVKIHFDDAINRVMTMSLIHQKMYQADNLAELDIADYFTTLLDELIRSSSVQMPVDRIVNAEATYIGSSSIVPLALLISELVSNSLKHAFTEKGRIFIGIYSKKDFIELVYIDNGAWKESSSENSFGLQLIEMLTEQMDGKAERVSDVSGTRYSFLLKRLDN